MARNIFNVSRKSVIRVNDVFFFLEYLTEMSVIVFSKEYNFIHVRLSNVSRLKIFD